MTDLSKSASPSEPRPVKMVGCEALRNGNEHFGIHDRNNFCEQRGCVAEPRRDERARFATAMLGSLELCGIVFHEDLLDEGTPWECVAEPEPQYFETLTDAVRFYGELAARASAAPLKQTAEIRNQILEEAALETLSFLEEVPAEKWPPFGLCPERNRAGDSAETARNIAGAIRKLKSAASLPQPSAGHEWLLNKLKKGERDFRDQSSSNFPGSKISLYFAQLLELYKTDFGAPSAGQTEGTMETKQGEVKRFHCNDCKSLDDTKGTLQICSNCGSINVTEVARAGRE